MSAPMLPMMPLPWWKRMLVRLVGADVIKAFSTLPDEHVAGADFATGQAAWPEIPPDAAMSAWAVFPWVWAAGTAISGDLSRLPLRLYQGTGKDRKRLDSHPMLDLLNRPSTRVSGRSFRSQCYLDRAVVANSYILELGTGTIPTSLLRLHPNRTKIVPDTDGQPKAYEYDGAGALEMYDWDDVQHISGPSWEDTPAGLYGTSPVRALLNYLNADQAAWKRQANAHQQGRPDAIVSPDTGDNAVLQWTPKQMSQMRESIENLFAQATGGIATLNAGVKIETLSWSPANLESSLLHDDVREAVIAVFGVPPVRLGLETANYATAKEQSFVYWDDTLRSMAADFDDAFTEIARRFGPDLWVEHDFSAVAALRHSRTEQVNRAQQLWLMGINLEDALASEGLDEVPVPKMPVAPAKPSAAPANGDSDEDAKAIVSWLFPEQRPGLAIVDRAYDPPVTEEARVDTWRSFESDIHKPGERAFQLDFQRYQNAAKQRYAERLAKVLGDRGLSEHAEKQLSPSSLAEILDSAFEDEQLSEAIGPEMRKRFRLSFDRAAEQVGADITFDPTRSTVETHLAKLSPQVNDFTREAVRQVIVQGEAAGWSIQEMQDAILQASEFSPRRALRVARTETTRQANAGALQAYDQANEAGMAVKKEWLTARDGGERHPSYPGLDGQVRAVGESFEVGDASGQHPGDTGEPGEDINCRCTVLPVLE